MRKPPAKKSRRHVPARLDSTRALLAFQRLMHGALLRPLAEGDRMQPRWTDGRSMAEVAEEFIKPNDRLTAFERLEIYNRMYWFRIIDCFYDDNPGLLAALGPDRFNTLAIAYLTRHPSHSFTLRNLCSKLEEFIRAEPRWTKPGTALALDIARFEWAQTVAFDEPGLPVVKAEEFGRVSPARLRLGVQPYVTLLDLKFPIDRYVIAVKRRDTLRSEASNATTSTRSATRGKSVPLPKPDRTFVAVHRVDNRLYYKRLEPAAFRILVALRDGQSLARAVVAGGREVTANQVRDWFALWTELGWLCRRK